MAIHIAKEHALDKQEMRAVCCNTMMELAAQNKDIVVLDADLVGASGLKKFAENFPDQLINCGIQEANMIGVAAGLSAVGKIPFAHTFGPFAARRACDQIYMSGAYAGLNVRIWGSDPGITATLNGGTHMPFEDMGIMRAIPSMTTLEPTDCAMLADLLRQTASLYGMFYLRFPRKSSVQVYEEGSTFTIGKAVHLRDGGDVTVIASGYCVAEAIKAADMLAEEGISVRLLNLFTWKPIDAEAIVAAAEKTGAIVTAENHNILGGLGSAVAEVLVRTHPVPMEMVGVRDEFGEVGPEGYLAERFHLTAPYIVNAVKKVLERKK